jgi:hypothetical protein
MENKESYSVLLDREYTHMKLLFDLISLNLPVESYMPLIKYKLKQLTEELQEYNRKSMESVLGSRLPKQMFEPTNGFIDNRPINRNIGHLAGGSKNVSNDKEIIAFNNLTNLTQDMIEEFYNIKGKYKIKGLEEKIQKFLSLREKIIMESISIDK